jgi:DNA invertase Pin-like site-specific DNA recombinase
MFFKTLRVVGYVRTSAGSPSRELQCETIKNHCQEQRYRLLAFYYDEGEPALGLAAALSGLQDVDGLAVYDLSRLVSDGSDGKNDMTPLIMSKFIQARKKIIAVCDGIENATTLGAAELQSWLKEYDSQNVLSAAVNEI